MFRFICENARTFRALVAVCVAFALSVLFISHEITLLKEKERLVFRTNGVIWRMSETIFEIQRLSSDLVGYSEGRKSKSDVEMRFDILWGRLDLVVASEIGKAEGLAPVIAELQSFLAAEEGAIYRAEDISAEDVLRVHSALDEYSTLARQAWAITFSNEDRQRQFVELQDTKPPNIWVDVLGYTLIALLMVYVVSEVFWANRAQKREQRLRRMANSANEAKTRFLANVSHEIRTPLNGVLGMASELSESKLNDDQRKCLNILEQSGNLLLCTINDVLDLSKVEAGRLDIEEVTFDLHAVLVASRDLHERRAREKGVALLLTISDQVPRWVKGDGRRLQQVVHNLVANAVKFTGSGRILIEAGRAYDARGISICVKDTGLGIPTEAQEKIFEPFVQADASVTRHYGGTGLGLAISRQISDAMGGRLTVKSEAGRGSCFEVQLPLPEAVAAEVVAQTRPISTRNLRGRRILVADDNATNRLILERFLAPSDCIIYTASSGEEAVTLASDTEFDVILMDIQMPDLDGVEATRRIRHDEAKAGRSRVPIFAVTANVLSHQVSEYIAAGMDRVLPKPLPKQRLLLELSSLVFGAE